MSETNYTIALYAPEETADGRGRLLHAFTTARDLAESGARVSVFFDGIGVECLTAFHEKTNPFTQHYVKLFDAIQPFAQACHVCAKHFGADQAATALGVELVGGEDEHRSLALAAINGETILTF